VLTGNKLCFTINRLTYKFVSMSQTTSSFLLGQWIITYEQVKPHGKARAYIFTSAQGRRYYHLWLLTNDYCSKGTVISLLKFHKGSVQYELQVNASLWMLQVEAVKLLITVQMQHLSCVFVIKITVFIARGKFDGWNFKGDNYGTVLKWRQN